MLCELGHVTPRYPGPTKPSYLTVWHLETARACRPVIPSFRALSGRLKFTVRRHKFNKVSASLSLFLSRDPSNLSLEMVRYRLIPLGPVDPSFRALSGRLKFTVRRHEFNKDSLSRQSLIGTVVVVVVGDKQGVVVIEAGSYLRLIDSCITELKAQRPSKT